MLPERTTFRLFFSDEFIKSMTCKHIFMALLLALASHVLPAQQALHIEGVVTALGTEEPLTGVRVLAPAYQTGTYTDENGAYKLGLSAGNEDSLALEFSLTGYQTLKLRVPRQEQLIFNVSLVSENYTAEDVVITASRSFEQKQSDVTVSIEVVKTDAIDQQSTFKVEDVLTQIPGVDVINNQVNIRGSSGFAYGVGSRVMVMMDGLPLLSGDAAFAELNMIPVDNISQIEVVKGASSVLYGSGALGGVINALMAHPGEKPRTSIRLRGAVYDNPFNPALKWNKKAVAQASSHLFHSRHMGAFDLTGQLDLLEDKGYYEGKEKKELRAMILSRFRPKTIPGLTLGLNLSLRRDSSGSGLYWAGYYPDTLRDAEGKDSLITGGGLRYDTVGGGVYRRQLNLRYAVDPYIKFLTSGGNLFWYRGRYLRNTNANTSGQSSQNYVFYNDFLFQTTLAEKINWVSGMTWKHASARADSLYTGRKKGNEVGLYTQFDGKFGRLNTSLGLRLETAKIDTLPQETQPIFRAGVNYEVWRGGNVRASFGQAFRVPSVAERYVNTQAGGLQIRPNPKLASEKGFGAELGFRQGFAFGVDQNLKGFVDLALFTQNYDNMVEFGLKGLDETALGRLEFIPIFTSENISNARINGVEITLHGDYVEGRFSTGLHGGLTLLDPVNGSPAPTDQQIDLTWFRGAENFPSDSILYYLNKLVGDLQNPELMDNPEILKYRSKRTLRLSGYLGFRPVSFTANLRHRSRMLSIDQYLYLVVPDLSDFRHKVKPDGDTTVDFILGWDISRNHKFSLHLNNAFNQEYALFPGTLAEQRRLGAQWISRF